MTSREIAKMLREGLKPTGFRLRGSSFFRRRDTWAIINPQKSMSAERIAINYGIASFVLLDELNHIDSSKPPSVWDCHYRHRVNGADGNEKWWDIGPTCEVGTVVSEMAAAIEEQALPALDRLPDDESLIQMWTDNEPSGIGDVDRFRFLVYLLGRCGRSAEAQEALKRARIAVGPTLGELIADTFATAAQRFDTN